MSFTSLIDFLHFITSDSYKLLSSSLFQFLIYCFFFFLPLIAAFTLPLNQDGQMAKAGLSRLWDGGFWLCNQLLLKKKKTASCLPGRSQGLNKEKGSSVQ